MEKFYTVEQAADILQVAAETVRHWLQSEQLKGVMAGRFWPMQEFDLKAFLRVPDDKPLKAEPPELGRPKAKRSCTRSTGRSRTAATRRQRHATCRGRRVTA
jgi:excisionase family DNA binding protein